MTLRPSEAWPFKTVVCDIRFQSGLYHSREEETVKTETGIKRNSQAAATDVSGQGPNSLCLYIQENETTTQLERFTL